MRDQNLTCIGCPLGCSISVSLSDNGEVSEITGNTCKKGEEYARKEVTNPSRVVTSIVKINNGDVNMVSVKTAEDIPKGKIFDCMEALKKVTVTAPVQIGEVIIKNVCGTGVDVIATKKVNALKSFAMRQSNIIPLLYAFRHLILKESRKLTAIKLTSVL